MKNRLKLVLALGAMVALAGVASADNNVLDHSTYFQNATNGAKVDASGNAYTTESNPLDLKTSGFLLLISDTTAVGMADSSAVQTAYPGYVVHGFLVRVTPPAGAALPFTRLALALRTHLNGTADSVSTAPVPLRSMSNGANASADSLVMGQATAPTSLVTDDSEIIVTLSRADAGATRWAQGIQRFFPVKAAAGGGEVRLPNFSVRERVLSSSGNTNTVTVYAYCTALR